MSIARTIAALALALAALAVHGQEGEGGQDLKPAMRAAEAWLALVDAGRYGESWDDSAALFREAIPRLKWEAGVQGVRDFLGGVVSRKLRSAQYATTIPGAPAGEYVVIQFTTHFDKRPLSIETVTPMREKDGAWKVSGYFIR